MFIRILKAHSTFSGVMLGLASLLAGSLALGALTPAAASVGVCRSDPVFTMNNGKSITLNETITDTKADIKGGAYVLHIPTGTKVTKISYSGAVGSSQSTSWTADQPAGSYTATSTVSTTAASAPVTAYMTIGIKNSTSDIGTSNKAIPNSPPAHSLPSLLFRWLTRSGGQASFLVAGEPVSRFRLYSRKR